MSRLVASSDRRHDRAASLALAGLLIVSGLLAVAFGSAPASATPWTGPEPTPTDLVFYFHNSSTPVTVGATSYLLVMSTVNDTGTPWNGTGGLSVAAHYDSVSFVAAPQLAAPLALNGTVEADVYLNQSGSSLTGGSIALSVNEVSPTGALVLLGTGPAVGTSAIGAGGSIPSVVALAGPTLNATVPAGDSVQVNITITGTSATHYGIWWGDVNSTIYGSQVDLPASTYLTVGNVTVRNATGAAVSDVTQTGGNETLNVTAVVADPLGAYDFSPFPVILTVVNVTDAVVLGPTPMVPVPAAPLPGAPNGTYTASFNYSSLGPGPYMVTVRASDQTDQHLGAQDTLPTYFGRVATGTAPLFVGLPPVPVYVLAQDDRAQPLVGATVRVFGGSALLAVNQTNATGHAGFNLPNASSFTFKVFWQGVGVGAFVETVTAPNETFTLNAAVIYPTFSIVTASGGYPLPFALATVIHPNGTELPLVVASSSGTITFQQVPAGNYTFTVIYDDSEVVADRAVLASTDGPIPVTVNGVYPLVVLTTTGAGAPLSAVDVTVVNATTGATIASGESGSGAGLQFLVPSGVYVVTGAWSATFDLTGLSQTVTTVVTVSGPSVTTLSFDKAFPGFTSTNEFYLIVGYAALAAVVAVLVVLLVRRSKKTVPPLTPAPAISPAKADEAPEEPTSKGG
jgi:hypothetical protein